MAALLVSREQAKEVLDRCIRTGEELVSHTVIVENTGGYADWLHLFDRWKERTIAETRAIYDGDEMSRDFDAVTPATEHSSPRYTFPHRKRTLELALFLLRGFVERLPMAVEPVELRSAMPPTSSPDRQSPYGTRPTAELTTKLEDHFLEHKQTLIYDLHTKQANPILEDSVMDRIRGFWNAHGGTLLIGVEDRTGNVTGLGPDLKIAKDLDALVNRISQNLKKDVPSIAALVRIAPDPVGAEMVLRIDVPAGDGPIYRKDRLMVRINNTTQELKGASQLDYIRSRFGRF